MSFLRAWKIIWRNVLVFTVLNSIYYLLIWQFNWPVSITHQVTLPAVYFLPKIILPWSNMWNVIINPLGLLLFGVIILGIYKILYFIKPEDGYQFFNGEFCLGLSVESFIMLWIGILYLVSPGDLSNLLNTILNVGWLVIFFSSLFSNFRMPLGVLSIISLVSILIIILTDGFIMALSMGLIIMMSGILLAGFGKIISSTFFSNSNLIKFFNWIRGKETMSK